MASHLPAPHLESLQTPGSTAKDRGRFSRAAGGTATNETSLQTQEALLAAAAENRPLYRAPIIQTSGHRMAQMDTRSSLATRRRSVRDQKAPLGPRPPDFSPSKRVTSDSTAFAITNQLRTNMPSVTSEPFLGLSARRNASNSDTFKDNNNPVQPLLKYKAPIAPTQASTHLQTAPLPREPSLENFPQPGGLGYGRIETSTRQFNAGNVPGDLNASSRRIPSASPVRRQNPALLAARLPSESVSGGATSAPASSKTRRQSHMPPFAPVSASIKQPRKSVGPSYTIASPKARTVFDHASRSFIPDVPHTTTSRSAIGPGIVPSSRSNAGSTPVAWAEDMTPNSQARRQAKTRSLQQAPSAYQRNGLFEEPPLPKSAPLSVGEYAVGNKLLAQPSPTYQVLATRRQSTATGHVGGLGARTVSPTDVRRSRRMSVSHPPPMPTRSPTPELTFGQRPPPTPSTVPSQALSTAEPAFASLGIVNNQEIPELSQRVAPVRSASSRSSYTSARPSSSSSQHRASISNAPVRSPIIKTRSVQTSTGDDTEIVPPVPAIPKAYESPSDTSDKPYFQDMNPRFDGQNSAHRESKEEERFMTPVEEPSQNDATFRNAAQSRRPTFNTRRDSSKDVNNISKKHLPPDRLPPLNLLPLSTPTTARIESFAHQRNDTVADKATPLPYRAPPKTPSTPMTASKAMFPTFDLQTSFDMNSFPQFRSSTAYANQRSESSTLDGSGNDSPAVFARASPATSRHGPSPFGSFSLPRLNGEMQHLVPRHSRDEPRNTPEGTARPSKPLSRRPSTVTQTATDPPAVTNGGIGESETPPVGSSLRRKLSFAWRRSSSKASHSSPRLDDDYNSLPNSEMPPPKLPASATRHAPHRKSPKPSATSSQSNLSGALSTPESFQPQALDPSRTTSKAASAGTERPLTSVRSSGSLFSMQKMLGSRSSQGNLRTHRGDVIVDKVDAAAEEEMRKLASKRKEFEVAAKDLDDLQRKATAKDRVSPSQASRMAALNIFERGEIVDYRDVYFCGAKSAQKFVGDLSSESTNFGFDDERGDYNIVAGDHLAYRYEVIDILGKGSFGQVVRCVDHKSGKLVAIKIIRNKKRFHQQALVEVNILQKLRDWDPDNAHSMINFTQSFYFRGHLCISTELLGINLYEFIKAHDFSGFSIKLIRRFAKQMLSSLCLLQTHNVIHCDLKPENILLAHPMHSEIKTIDFGSSCFENEKVYTYIQSRFYRSPEVILGMTYSMPIDMWSLGCILAELHTGLPIFPGENEQEQLACIMEVFGPPEKHLIERSTRKKLFFDSLGKPRITVSSKGKRRRPSSKTLAQALKSDDDAFADFIARCLRWDPDRRLKPDEAMAHEFVTGTKKTSRSRAVPSQGAPSPAKKSSIQTPSKTRPQTEVTTAVSRNGGATSIARESPVKGGSRRKSSVLEQQHGTKWNGPAGASALPRVTQTRVSSKPDMASAASAAAMSSLSKTTKAKGRLAA